MPWYRTPTESIRIVRLTERDTIGPVPDLCVRFGNGQVLVTSPGFLQNQQAVRDWVDATFAAELTPGPMSDRKWARYVKNLDRTESRFRRLLRAVGLILLPTTRTS